MNVKPEQKADVKVKVEPNQVKIKMEPKPMSNHQVEVPPSTKGDGKKPSKPDTASSTNPTKHTVCKTVSTINTSNESAASTTASAANLPNKVSPTSTASLPVAKLPDPFPAPPKKKRGIVWNDFDKVIDQGVLLSSGIATVRRQQVKILKAFKHQLNCYEELTKENHRIHSMIKDWLDTRVTDMKSHSLTEIEQKQLLVKPDVFQPDDVADPKAFHFGHTHSTYGAYIREEEKKAKKDTPFYVLIRRRSIRS